MNSERPKCFRCKRIISEEEDILEHDGNIYCPICYSEKLVPKLSLIQIIFYIALAVAIFSLIMVLINI